MIFFFKNKFCNKKGGKKTKKTKNKFCFLAQDDLKLAILLPHPL